jgi:hypothetical protein
MKHSKVAAGPFSVVATFDNGDVLEHSLDLIRGYVGLGNAFAELKK